MHRTQQKHSDFLLKLQISRPSPRLAKSKPLVGEHENLLSQHAIQVILMNNNNGVETASAGTSAFVGVTSELLVPLLHDPGHLAGGTVNNQCPLALEEWFNGCVVTPSPWQKPISQ